MVQIEFERPLGFDQRAHIALNAHAHIFEVRPAKFQISAAPVKRVTHDPGQAAARRFGVSQEDSSFRCDEIRQRVDFFRIQAAPLCAREFQMDRPHIRGGIQIRRARDVAGLQRSRPGMNLLGVLPNFESRRPQDRLCDQSAKSPRRINSQRDRSSDRHHRNSDCGPLRPTRPEKPAQN